MICLLSDSHNLTRFDRVFSLLAFLKMSGDDRQAAVCHQRGWRRKQTKQAESRVDIKRSRSQAIAIARVDEHDEHLTNAYV